MAFKNASHAFLHGVTVGAEDVDANLSGLTAVDEVTLHNGSGTLKVADGGVTGTQLSAAAATKTIQVSLGSLSTSADEEVLIIAPVTGSLSLLTLSGKDALATDDTNYQALTLINKGQAGAGSTDMLSQTAGAKTTKTTGGQALVAYGKTVFPLHATGANKTVTKGDTLALKVTHNGTPANAVTECYAQLDFTFTA